jgi:hypothetical protein
MNKLNASGGDLTKSFGAYTNEVQDMEKAGAAARKRGDSIRGRAPSIGSENVASGSS